MKKFFILALIALVGLSLCVSVVMADSTRTIPHKFRAISSNTAIAQGSVLYRITGYASNSNAVFGIYNAATLATATASTVAVEGGEATSGDALPMYYFGEEGLALDTGMTTLVSTCTVVLEYR